MKTSAKQVDRRLATIVVFAAVCLLALVLACAVGCTPAASDGQASAETDQSQDSGVDLSTQAVDWTMQSDCSGCHTSEAESMTDAKCPQASAHKDVTCTACHTAESVLATAHEGVTYGDKPATKVTVDTVDEQTCIACHGTMEEMAAQTAGSTALTDSNGTSVNPHERPAGEKHEANPATCTDCHNNHSENLSKDAMRYCAQCHHRGVFTCGNCHAVD